MQETIRQFRQKVVRPLIRGGVTQEQPIPQASVRFLAERQGQRKEVIHVVDTIVRRLRFNGDNTARRSTPTVFTDLDGKTQIREAIVAEETPTGEAKAVFFDISEADNSIGISFYFQKPSDEAPSETTFEAYAKQPGDFGAWYSDLFGCNLLDLPSDRQAEIALIDAAPVPLVLLTQFPSVNRQE